MGFGRLRLVVIATSLHLGSGAGAADDEKFISTSEWNCGDANEEEYGDCGTLPACTQGADCVWALWGDWSTATDQACTRTRAIKTPAGTNGLGCSGNSAETKFCADANTKVTKDCVWGAWGPYSQCPSGDHLAQQKRTRPIATPATGIGKVCKGPAEETQGCGFASAPINCKLSVWNPWGACSNTCGQGARTRHRGWHDVAQHGGTPCRDYIREAGACMIKPCPGSVDCVMGAWSAWSGCSADRWNQKSRTRVVLTPPKNGGKACAGSELEEILNCPDGTGETCTFSVWTAWSACDVTCGTSQQRRHRVMSKWLYVKDMAKCPNATLQETRGCDNLPGCVIGTPCQISAWTAWSACSSPCDTGSKNRTRKIIAEATLGGKPCEYQSLEELVACENLPACKPVDCVWGPWNMWDACTATCGGGTFRRTRRIAKAPVYDGSKSCAETENDPKAKDFPFKQISACNTQPCPKNCVNGTYAAWGDWNTWSATCGKPYRSRKRPLQQVPNSCGHPAVGEEEDFVSQVLAPCIPELDCKLSPWSEWSACSSSCFGMKDRSRLVETFASGGGDLCNKTALQELLPCHPGPNQQTPSSCQVLPNRSCELSVWSQWSECPVTCGGGQHTRGRHVIQPPSGGGEPCDDAITETRTCNMNKCGAHCIDCQWGHWDDWGACTKCGGQRYRARRVVQLPNHCGERCVSRSSLMTARCSANCSTPRWCIWGDWSVYSACSATCGGAIKQRQRNLMSVDKKPASHLFIAYHHMMCAGTRFEATQCPGLAKCGAAVCSPVNCAFDTWSKWFAPQMTGLCQRSRVVKTLNNKCGTPCNGHLIETKVCVPAGAAKVDCELSKWSPWSQCPQMHGQKYKLRDIRRQAANGGSVNPCVGALRETLNCATSANIIDCGFTPWTTWGACTQTCSGIQYRTRQSGHPPNANGGSPCVGPTRQIQQCGAPSCASFGLSVGQGVNCAFGDWSAYGVCFNGQKVRTRVVSKHASPDGTLCTGPLEDTAACGEGKVDCKISDWTAWGTCSHPSGGGQQTRHRNIFKHPKNGGAACPTANQEVQPCNTQIVGNTDCVLNAWGQWSTCSTPQPNFCMGQLTRTRSILHNRQNGGKGCKDPLIEVIPCGTPTAQCAQHTTPTNCVLTAWTGWSQCSKQCDTGYQTRTKTVTLPSPGGQKCTGTPVLKESQACNTKRCDGTVCTDAVWGAWTQWGACTSADCPGVQTRTRVVATQASSCGKSAVGSSEETQACNAAKNCANSDCKFHDWASWAPCSRSCNGYTTRKRVVIDGTGTGQYCKGPSNEIAPCSPGTGLPPAIASTTSAAPTPAPSTPTPSPTADCPALFSTSGKACVWGIWSAWTACTRQCDGGSQDRHRTFVAETPPGKPCSGSSSEVQKCNWQNCAGSAQNCMFSDWSDWGGCSLIPSSTGVTKRVESRTRQVSQAAKEGGAPCKARDSKEQREGGPSCKPLTEQSFCDWGTWQAWSACSRTCGTNGKRTRKRILVKKRRLLSVNLTAPERKPSSVRLSSLETKDDAEALSLPFRQAMEEAKAFRKEYVARQGDMHAQELIMSFVAGCAAMFLLLGAFRLCSTDPSRQKVSPVSIESDALSS